MSIILSTTYFINLIEMEDDKNNLPAEVYNSRIRSKLNSRRASLGGKRLSLEEQRKEHQQNADRKMSIQEQKE